MKNQVPHNSIAKRKKGTGHCGDRQILIHRNAFLKLTAGSRRKPSRNPAGPAGLADLGSGCKAGPNLLAIDDQSLVDPPCRLHLR